MPVRVRAGGAGAGSGARRQVGHDHLYERGVGATPDGPLTYVVGGGVGAPLYSPRCRAAPGPLPACPPSVAALTSTYHYVMVEVSDRAITLCPRRPDSSPVEACVELPARRLHGSR